MSAELANRDRNERSRRIMHRWQDFEGEAHAAVVRMILIIAFYAIQLGCFASLSDVQDSDRFFHRIITFISAGWLFLTLGVFLALRAQWMPAALKYVTTFFDIALIVLLASLGHASSSPIVCALFVAIALSALRMRIRLVWFATIASMIGYLVLVGRADSKWFDADHSTPLLTQGITLCSLLAMGLILDQFIRSNERFSNALADISSTRSAQENSVSGELVRRSS